MKSLKGQLLVIFSLFIVISVITALYTANYYKSRERILKVDQQIDRVEILLLKSFKEQENFFNFETINENFFMTGESTFIDEYEQTYTKLLKSLNQLGQHQLIDQVTKDKLVYIDRSLVDFDSLFTKMVKTIKKRGFRNFGLEGEMRESIHQLEDIPLIDLADILMLRRHEKDYILRQDPLYIEMHENKAAVLKSKIEENEAIPSAQKEKVLQTLANYTYLFNQVALYERIIGLKSNSGFKNKLNEKANDIIVGFDDIKQKTKNHQEALLDQLNFSIIIFWVIYLFASIALCLKISGHFTKRLTTLSRHINYFVNSNFTSRMKLEKQPAKDEVGRLWNNFKRMETEIIDYIELFKEKVDEKTLELVSKTEKIEKQNLKIQQQKEKTDQQNKDLLDGMRYGWRIQRTLLPTPTKLKALLGRSFIFFSPKDIVSGDIYWAHKLESSKGAERIFSVIDCTGHGVPGAFMSILANNAIDHAVFNEKVYSTDGIVQSANNYIYSSLKYYVNDFKGNHYKDGMDMAICKLDRKALQLEYTGAHRPLILIRHKRTEQDVCINLEKDAYTMIEEDNYLLFEVSATKRTVGTLNEDDSRVFSAQTLTVKEGDMIYLMSDGYADQFGGPKNKKFMMKRLKQLLIRIHEQEENEQKEALRQTLLDWKADTEQIDDICVMGVRV